METTSNLQDLISLIGGLISDLIPIAAGAAVLFFFWGLAKYVLAAGNKEKEMDGRRLIVNGLIAIFIIAALWGIIQWIGGVLDIPVNGGTFVTPSVEGIQP